MASEAALWLQSITVPTHRPRLWWRRWRLGPAAGGKLSAEAQTARCCAGRAGSVVLTDTPSLARVWLSVQSFIQETRPNIPGLASCWELAQRPSNDPPLGPSPAGGDTPVMTALYIICSKRLWGHTLWGSRRDI